MKSATQLVVLLGGMTVLAAPALAADPIKIGCSSSMTGGVAVNGKQVKMGFELWRDDINAKGGLLGRQVELDCYDDQSNPALDPGIYTKLLAVDKIDLVIASGTNYSAAAMPVETAGALPNSEWIQAIRHEVSG